MLTTIDTNEGMEVRNEEEEREGKDLIEEMEKRRGDELELGVGDEWRACLRTSKSKYRCEVGGAITTWKGRRSVNANMCKRWEAEVKWWEFGGRCDVVRKGSVKSVGEV